jgi:hypothetical protein
LQQSEKKRIASRKRARSRKTWEPLVRDWYKRHLSLNFM